MQVQCSSQKQQLILLNTCSKNSYMLDSAYIKSFKINNLCVDNGKFNEIRLYYMNTIRNLGNNQIKILKIKI